MFSKDRKLEIDDLLGERPTTTDEDRLLKEKDRAEIMKQKLLMIFPKERALKKMPLKRKKKKV